MGNQKHFFNLFLGMGLNVILGVITTPIITRLVDPIAYGDLALFTLFGNIFMLIGMLGYDQAYVRFYYVKEETSYKQYILAATSKTPIFISLIAAAIVFAYYIFIDKMNTEVLPVFSLYLIVLTIGCFANYTIRLKLRTTLYSVIINLQKLLYVALVIVAVFFSDIEHLLVLTGATVVSQAVACLIGIIAERKVWSLKNFSPRLKEQYSNVVSAKDIAKYGFPLVFANLCNWIFTGADKVMIRIFSNGTELGIYASAVSVVGIFSIITSTFSTVWGPMAVEEYEKGKENRNFFIKMADYVCILMFAMGAVVVLGKDIIVYLLGEEYRDAASLIPFLTLHPIMYTLSESTVYGINFARKTRYHIVVTVICCILNIMLNLLLIPVLGSLGAAIATGISYTMFFILGTFFSMRCFYVKYTLNKIAVMTILYYIIIIYGSFNKTDLACALMFIAYAAVCILMYKTRILELIILIIAYIKDMLSKFIRR